MVLIYCPFFKGSDAELFNRFTNTIKEKRAELFGPNVRFISEPGRYFAAASRIFIT